MEPVPELISILCHNGVLLYCSQAEQLMYSCDEADPAGKILFHSSENQNEAAFSGQAVMV
jgi:hypothetical protein